MDWQNTLLDWYEVHKRDFPWRQTKDPYKIWLSEVIMQQTRTQQGLPYYNAFIAAYPTVHDLANAQEATVLKFWQGLGYYSRARNLHTTAKYISEKRGGDFPDQFTTLLTLKGVGDYTASAIASIAFDLPHAVVDGNVYRVYARFFGIDIPLPSTVAFKIFKKLAQEVLPSKDPGTFNQAVMELGALQCVPQNPNCTVCPLVASCKAHQWERVAQLPVKSKKPTITKRYFNYLVFRTPEGMWHLEQRHEPGIWHKLFQFPLVELKRQISRPNKVLLETVEKYTSNGEKPRQWKPAFVHKLSHQHITIVFWYVQVTKFNHPLFTQDAVHSLAVPVPIANFLKEFNEKENSYI
ncbi:MAG: A/G-specific adenine glycosylase [Flavobacteriaceae bacterium]